MASSKQVIVAFDLYGTLLSTDSIAKELSNHFGGEKAAGLARLWRTYQLEYTWRCNSMSMVTMSRLISRNNAIAKKSTSPSQPSHGAPSHTLSPTPPYHSTTQPFNRLWKPTTPYRPSQTSLQPSKPSLMILA